MSSTNPVSAFYDNSVELEWSRLENHRIEFELNKRFIYKYISAGDSVLDIGGGPGRYALDMAGKGCSITLVDLSQGNIDFAKAKAAELGVEIDAKCGDARCIESMVHGPFDAVLLMGPLYHLPAENDRMEAVQAALRLLKPNGLFFAAFISSFAAMWDFLAHAPEVILDKNMRPCFDLVLDNKSFGGLSFTEAHFTRPSDVTKFMNQFQLKQLHLLGSEGILATRESELMNQPKEVLSAWIDFAEKLCEREDLISLAHHFLYVGRKL